MTVTSVGSLMKYVQEVALQCKSGNGTGESGPDDFVEVSGSYGRFKLTSYNCALYIASEVTWEE